MDDWAGGCIVKLNNGGLILCAVYLGYFILLSVFALVTGDPHGLFGQLSIAPFVIVGVLLVSVGLGDLFTRFLDILHGAVAIPISFIIVYLTGWAMSAFYRKLRSVKPDPSTPLVDPPSWSDRP